MITGVTILVVGIIIGLIYSHKKHRVQCTNCGGFNTYLAAAGFGGEGGVYGYVVKHSEQHVCKKCGRTTYVKMTLVK